MVLLDGVLIPSTVTEVQTQPAARPHGENNPESFASRPKLRDVFGIAGHAGCLSIRDNKMPDHERVGEGR
jgi:hypothetical protein